jgi:hypothetical protein
MMGEGRNDLFGRFITMWKSKLKVYSSRLVKEYFLIAKNLA